MDTDEDIYEEEAERATDFNIEFLQKLKSIHQFGSSVTV